MLQRDLTAWPGMVAPALAGLTDRRLAAATASGYPEAIEALAARSPFMPLVFEAFRSGWGHHLGEYVVHTEDLIRPARLPALALDQPTRDALWRRVLVAAPQLHHRSGRGLVLVRTDAPASACVLTGPDPLTVRGAALELLVWAHRGGAAADVEVDG